MRVLASMAIAAALCACHEGGGGDAAKPPPLTAAAVRAAATKLVLCQTTEDELRNGLGAPYRDGRIAAGRILSWLPKGDEASRHYLAVLVRADNRVVDVYFDVPTEARWVPADHCPPQQ